MNMRRLGKILIATIAAAASGCLYEGEYVRSEPQPYVPAPPPPAADTAPDTGVQSTEAPPPPAGSDIPSEDVFYERLSPYGSWTYVAPYGRVWVPAVGYGWRPYYYGQWVLTDWGWTFVSDDPWAWAGYHYGRWNWGIGLGWYWVPGLVWGPAWVSWRYGGGYAAWCPLGPRGVYFGYRHPGWVAVPEQHFTRPIAHVAVPLRATASVVASAQPLSGPHAMPARGGSFGPPVANIARATGQTVRPQPARAVMAQPSRSPATASVAHNNVMRSPVQPRTRAGSGGDTGRAAPPARPSPGYRPVVRPGPAPRTRSGTGGGWSRAPSSGGGWSRAPSSGGGGSSHAPSSGGAPHASAPSGGGGHSSGGHSGGHAGGGHSR
jgi:hypothetical protein